MLVEDGDEGADGEQRGFVWVKGVGDEVRSKPESGDSGIASPG